MELRACNRPSVRRVAMTAALGALLVPVAAGQADARTRHRSTLPVITSVSPMKLAVGQTLTLRGRNFRRGKGKNVVLFKRSGARAVFVRSDISTAKLLKVKVPAALANVLLVRGGSSVGTRFQLRVLASRLGAAFTAKKHSPVIVPLAATTPADSPAPDCDGDGTPDAQDSDDDNDLLPDTLETSIGTQTCNADSDGDGVSDGFEYQSARDLNDDDYQDPNRYLPYPGKRPYPNPLYAGDANMDFDGDGLTSLDEYALWQYTVKTEGAPADLSRLTYSAGRRYSIGQFGADGRWHGTLAAAGYDHQAAFLAWAALAPAFDSGNGGYGRVFVKAMSGLQGALAMTPGSYDLRDFNLDGTVDPVSEAEYYDFDHNGVLSDDERDEDSDGLTNFDESHGRMLPGYWAGVYQQERAYPLPYDRTDMVDPDTDGDGVRDGADDQDQDDVPNLMELSRRAARGTNAPGPATYGRVNPLNPCLPDITSRTCTTHPDLANPPAPFDGSPDWASLN